MTKRNKILFWVGVVAVVFLLAIAAGLIYFIASLNSPSEATARFIPARAPVYVSLNLRPGLRQLNHARDFFTKLQTDDVDDRVNDELEKWEETTRIHFRDDVSSWLGTDISFITLDANLEEPEWVAMIQVSDMNSAADFLDDLADYFEDKSQMEFETSDDQRVELWEAIDEPIAFGVAIDYMLIADSTDTIIEIADNLAFPPARSLLDNDLFIKARDMLPDRRVLFAFVQSDALFDEFQDAFDPYDDLYSEMRQLERHVPEFLAVSSSFIDNGVRVDISYETPSGSYVLDSYEQILAPSVLPVGTLAMFAGTGFEEVWEGIEELLIADSASERDYYAFVDEVRDEFGIDLERDVIDALDGEYGFALLPSEVNSQTLVDFGFEQGGSLDMLAFGSVKDSDRIEITLDTMIERFEAENIDVNHRSLGNYEAVSVPLDQGEFKGSAYEPGYILASDWLVVGSTNESLEAFHDSLIRDSEALDASDEFARLIQETPDPLHYVAYVDIARTLEMVEDALSSENRSAYRREVRPFVENLSAIMIGGSFTHDQTRITAALTLSEDSE